MRTAMILMLVCATMMASGCCSPWRNITDSEPKTDIYEPWVGPGERGTYQRSTCTFWVANLVGIAALPEYRLRLNAGDGRTISSHQLMSSGAWSEVDILKMLDSEFAAEWSMALAQNDAWLADQPRHKFTPPYITFPTFGVLVAIDPLVWIVKTAPQAAGPGIRYRDGRLLGQDVAAAPRPFPESTHAEFGVNMPWFYGYSGHSIDLAMFRESQSPYWFIDDGTDASPQRIDSSDPDTMRVKTNWGWLIASFDEEGALKVEGVAELPDTAPR